MNAWNQNNGATFANLFTEDGDLVGFDSHHLKGRGEIGPFHQRLFDKWLKGSRLVGKTEDVRFLSPDVALMHGVGGTIMREGLIPSRNQTTSVPRANAPSSVSRRPELCRGTPARLARNRHRATAGASRARRWAR
jgi:uncharacterized protein (TIGR02246 family)